MSRTRIWTVAITAFAVLALGWSNVAHATPGVCKPVRACEAVKPVPLPPVCQPVKKVLPPACQPVKACEPVDGSVRHVAVRSHIAPLATARVRLASHVGHRHAHGVVYAAPEGAAPSPAPKLPAAPAPAPAKA
jgi:hypothetical protein